MADPTTRVTGLTLPNLCFGTSALSSMPDTYGYGVEPERARATLRAVLDGPIKFLDTARIYGGGKSEELIGEVLGELGGLPTGAIISTKLDRDIHTGRFDAAQARRSLEQSLKALRLDRVHLLHIHDPEYATELEEVTGTGGAVDELFRMKEEGLADAVGIAAGRVDVMTPMLAKWNFDALITHNRFTLVNRSASAMIDFAVSRGTAVLNAAPYGSGVLAKGSRAYPRFAYQAASNAVLDAVRRFEAICAASNIPLGAAALQFSMRDPRIASTICGVSKPERVEETLQWGRWPISEDAWKALAEVPFSTDDPEATRDYTAG